MSHTESIRTELQKVTVMRQKAARKLFSAWFFPLLWGPKRLRRLQELRAREEALRAQLGE